MRRILGQLINRSQELFDQTDDPIYIAIEHWARDVLVPEELRALFDTAQDRFSSYGEAQRRWLDTFGSFLQLGERDVDSFAENLLLTHFFHLGTTANTLWEQYERIQRSITREQGNAFPRSWGEWLLPVQGFMGIVEEVLIDHSSSFANLQASEDVEDILEEETLAHPAEEFPSDLGIGFISDAQFNQATALTAYLSACAETIGHIDLYGYLRSDGPAIPLSDVYVPLRLSPLATCSGLDRYVRYQTATYDDPELHLFREPLLAQELEGQPALSIHEVLDRHREILILGCSGGGKTTLLRHLALEHARMLLTEQESGLQIISQADGSVTIRLVRPLPIYIDLAEYVDNREPDEPLEQFMLRSATELAHDERVAPLIADLLEYGQCLILLDGLDQAATDEQRRMLVTCVSQAASRWRAKGNRIIVTSRFAGYTTVPLPPSFAGYLIRPLERSQFGPLLLRWALTLARIRRPLLTDDEAHHQAQAETLALMREITTNARLSHLAGNPLILRMLVGIYQPGVILNAQRAAIYQLTADTLIREWRLPQSAAPEPVVLEQEVTPLLGELAYWLQTSRTSGVLTAEELRGILEHAWSALHPDATEEQTAAAIDDFMGRLRSHGGVLIEVSPRRYAFLYPALQEYFAARFLVASYRTAAERIRAILHDPRWDEVIRLAIGFTSLGSRDNASDLIETAILAQGERAEQLRYTPSLFEDTLRRDLFFAARLLGEGIEVRPEVSERIVGELVGLWVDGERDSAGRFNLIFDAARRHLMNLDGTSASHRALQITLRHLASPHEHKRAYAADAMTFWASHLSEGRDALVRHAEDAPPLVRRATAEALGRVGPLSLEAYMLLLRLVSDGDERVSSVAQRTLEEAAPVPQQALGLWIEMLQSNDPTRRRLSLRNLRLMGSLPPLIIGELLGLINDPNPSIRQAAVEALSGVATLPDDALLTVCRAGMDGDAETRLAALRVLHRPIELPREVVRQIIRWTGDPEVPIRHAAVLALGACRNRSREVLDALIECLDDPASVVRAAAVEPLATKGQEDDRVIHMLSHHTVSDPDYAVRRAVARAFRHFPNPAPDVRQALMTLLSDGEMIVREATLDTIAALNDPGPEIIEYLISLVAAGEQTIRARAVRALSSLRGLPDEALSALVSALPDHWETLGEAIQKCLWAHRPLNTDLVFRLIDLAVAQPVGSAAPTSIPVGLQALALETLGYEQENAGTVTRVLLQQIVTSSEMEVQIAALRGLAHATEVWEDVKRALVSLIREGPLPVRCAAAVAVGRIVRNVPDPPFHSQELIDLAHEVENLLRQLTPRASWEAGTETQNELFMALSWLVARARPTPLRLPARLDGARQEF